jgi:hypothetical protein
MDKSYCKEYYRQQIAFDKHFIAEQIESMKGLIAYPLGLIRPLIGAGDVLLMNRDLTT